MDIQEAKAIISDAYQKLQRIPSDKWCNGFFSRPATRQCCAIGHYQRLTSKDPKDYSHENCSDGANRADREKSKLRVASNIMYSMMYSGQFEDIASINNNIMGKYQQDTPKARVMAFLKDAMEYEEEN